MSLVRTALVASFIVSAVACSSTPEATDTSGETVSNIEGAASGGAKCSADEKTVFACKTAKGKQLSICASSDISATKGYVQYRYGTDAKTELTLPNNDLRNDFRDLTSYSESDSATSGSSYATTVRFVNGPYLYRVYYNIGHGQEGAGVTVEKGADVIAEIACDDFDTSPDTATLDIAAMPFDAE